jgi:hypothetical protein
MKILVCGGRDYFDAERIDRILDLVMPSFVIHGCARGADALAANWAVKRGVPHQCYKADWHTHGKGAGHIRNRQMLLEGKPQMVIAFPGGSGTADMVGRSMQRGVPVVEFE